MRFIQRFERRLEGAVDDAFARVFGGKIMPAEVESALHREADQGVRMHGDRALAPNHYVLTVSDSDEENLTADAELTMRSFARHLSGYIDDQGWETYGDVSVELQSSPALHTGQFRAHSTVNPDSGDPAPADPPSAQPMRTGAPQMPSQDQPAQYESPGRTSGPLPSERYAARGGGGLNDTPAPDAPEHDQASAPHPAPAQGPPPDRPAPYGAGEPSGGPVGPGPYPQAPPQRPDTGYARGEYAPEYEPHPAPGGDPRGYSDPYGPQYGSPYEPRYDEPGGGYPPYPQPGYGDPGYDRPAYGDPRYGPPGHPPQGYPQQGYPPQNPPRYDQPEHPPTAAWSQPRAQGVRLMLDDGSGRTYDLRRGSNVIGRGQVSHFRVPDTGVSRRHANIEWDGDVALLVDLRSTNGTVVNGNPVTEWQLAHGDIVRVGHTDIAVQFR